MSLTNTLNKSEVLRRRARATAWHPSGDVHPWRKLGYDFAADSAVTLGPLEIKTFVLALAR